MQAPDETDVRLADPADPADRDGLRRAIRAWIAANVPPAWADAAASGDLALLHQVRSPEAYRSWYPVLGRSGLVTPTWPREYGGLGLDQATAHVVWEELRAARLVTLNIIGIALAAPALLQYGSQAQCERLLPPIADNSQIWCQLFSEPGAGSDLAGLSTRAVQTAEGWRVGGQKLWSSFANEAARGILLARTDPSVPKHQGITAFLLDMRQPGVTVRPLRKITGDSEFNEVFLDGALVADEDRLGAVGAGWPIARTVLMHEGTMLSGAGSGLRERTSGASIDRLVELASRPTAALRPIDDPVRADEIARLFIENTVLRLTNQRNQEQHGTAVEPALIKIMSSEHNQRLQSAIFDLLGDRALAHSEDDGEAARIVVGYLRSRGDTIGGGTSEVHRNNVAERMLNLPKDPFSDSRMPWRDIARGPR
jgi:alkylation response protein AidB-like acyl-CoA dehydrogenase